jgi:hypothetical protein
MFALYLTIWLALALFAIGETGRAFARHRSPPGWAWWAFTLGLVLAIIHTLLSFDIVHNWVHDDAVRATAMQTEAMFGVSVGWGVYVNYLFFAVWLADAWWWRSAPAGYLRPPAVTWTLRAFYMVVIFNAAVIFAVGWRRLLGLVLVSWLSRAWSAGVTAPPSSSRGSR